MWKCSLLNVVVISSYAVFDDQSSLVGTTTLPLDDITSEVVDNWCSVTGTGEKLNEIVGQLHITVTLMEEERIEEEIAHEEVDFIPTTAAPPPPPSSPAPVPPSTCICPPAGESPCAFDESFVPSCPAPEPIKATDAEEAVEEVVSFSPLEEGPLAPAPTPVPYNPSPNPESPINPPEAVGEGTDIGQETMATELPSLPTAPKPALHPPEGYIPECYEEPREEDTMPAIPEESRCPPMLPTAPKPELTLSAVEELCQGDDLQPTVPAPPPPPPMEKALPPIPTAPKPSPELKEEKPRINLFTPLPTYPGKPPKPLPAKPTTPPALPPKAPKPLPAKPAKPLPKTPAKPAPFKPAKLPDLPKAAPKPHPSKPLPAKPLPAKPLPAKPLPSLPPKPVRGEQSKVEPPVEQPIEPPVEQPVEEVVKPDVNLAKTLTEEEIQSIPDVVYEDCAN